MTVDEINCALARALGVTDLTDVYEVTLRIRANDLPNISVERRIWTAANQMVANIEMLRVYLAPM